MPYSKLNISLTVTFCFLSGYFAVDLLRPGSGPYLLRYLSQYVIWSLAVIICFKALGWKLNEGIGKLGLKSSFNVGLLWAFLFSLPMLVGFIFSFQFNTNWSSQSIILGSIVTPFFEELFYRGFLFGILLRFAKWPFLLAALFSSMIFGVSHWFQGSTITQAALAATFTGIGGLWFAWLYRAWNFNLWLVISLHGLMNLYWYLWQVDNTAVGPETANILRMSTILFSILITIIWHRRNKYN